MQRNPPQGKVWETTGAPGPLVIGHYRNGASSCRLKGMVPTTIPSIRWPSQTRMGASIGPSPSSSGSRYPISVRNAGGRRKQTRGAARRKSIASAWMLRSKHSARSSCCASAARWCAYSMSSSHWRASSRLPRAARYAGGKGGQADVLRAEVEVARAQAASRSLAADISAAEAMLNVSLGRCGVAAGAATRIPGACRRAACRGERAIGCGREST